MKIGILTYYGVHNHGAVLQANGLKKCLNELGHEVSFLSFERNYDFIPKENAKKYKGGLTSIPFYFKYVFQKGISNILYNYKKKRVLDSYRSSNIPIKQTYKDFNGDAVIIGSDEVFSLEIGYNPCLYGIGVPCDRIISYAGSFGPTTINDIKKKALDNNIKNGLKQLTKISVRDNNSSNVVNELIGENAVVVCDPVILYGYREEIKKNIISEKNYIVIYAYDRSMQDEHEIEEIKKFAKKYDKKIYSLAYHHRWCDKNIQVSPDELLGWINGADCVITDTFHGTVLSLICNTPMIVKLRNNVNKLAFLLEEYGLKNRIVENFNNIESVYKMPIDFNSVNNIIDEKRKFSKQFLNDALKG